ncbi:MAG: pyruvate, phosphate dikinase [Candidatus Marinimicrobia bacterium]|jgi:pyruvate,orthophosphate dikinase|nr:pyruvate, phosphate dikinase [Candidatus Neomarinimicrobiota bacterium]MBT3631662.1 pyruvate, phosphate dikinase [Candidatus Neomarinimicrobiota bacterium]MBT3825863.1 pyruvate, phosphate dikinase [Candidatus Neomarinimicrobiota bacterium]MBT4129960.1 pyruvate, phosphate dikinase [Candidatus Neomarinimicrobiota bacterium]MBT4296054.1 pyruvate, phosphate dikinase [Candidatus Neomarinimicrobiota bacterium]
MTKRVYTFGGGKAEGDASYRNLLGGKGANLAEMSGLGIPVPAGFTITTEVCTEYNKVGHDRTVELIKAEVEAAVKEVEAVMGAQFCDEDNPLLLSVRSGARVSMPGMMDTVLNLGLNDSAVEALAKKSGNERFAWDSYRRFVQMYGDVVLGMKPESKEDIDPFEKIMEDLKESRGYELDTEFTVEDLKTLVSQFKAAVTKKTGHSFPDNPWDQLWGSVMAVFDSWETPRAVYYRMLNKIPGDWGTAVNVQAMVFGNMGDNSGTGVAFTRDAGTGENIFNGEYLINAQGEDVVAGTRTPQQITKIGSERWAVLADVSETERAKDYPSLEELMPEIYTELDAIQHKLEDHYKDMQDVEFTMQDGKLWMLQTRSGKRTGAAMVRIAMEQLEAGEIDDKEALMRVEPNKLDELLHPVFDKEAMASARVLTKGLPASPGAATGQLVFHADEASKYKNSILARIETSPEDLEGMNIANGILTARGGMTSHAAVVARGMGKCCVSGAGEIKINYKARTLTVQGDVFQEGDWVSLNGSTGEIFEDKIKTIDPEVSGDFGELMELTNKFTRMYVRTNADTPRESKIAREFGAKGIGLCRTEHMFFEGDKIVAMREMILAEDQAGREAALERLLPIQQKDFEGIFEAMQDLPVTVRLLDPPLHEFVPHDDKGQQEMADVMGVDVKVIADKVEDLAEFNPMLGHRGCRLGNTYPEITVMQTKAIMGAALALKAKGIVAKPEIMIPLTGTLAEMELQEKIVRETIKGLFAKVGDSVDHLVGTMIEIPRAALIADKIATSAEFFSFGTNDLTQMTFGYSRDDAGKFLPVYLEKGLLKNDPFEVLDQEGVGQLVEMACRLGKETRPDIKLGICGEHGGEPSSVEFCHRVGLEYVSCSPFRVPIARLAAAQAAAREL